jgi:hypothetical protein
VTRSPARVMGVTGHHAFEMPEDSARLQSRVVLVQRRPRAGGCGSLATSLSSHIDTPVGVVSDVPCRPLSFAVVRSRSAGLPADPDVVRVGTDTSETPVP